MKNIFLTILCLLALNISYAEKYYPGRIYLKSGEVIIGEMEIPSHASKRKLKYIDSIDGAYLDIKSTEIDYLTINVAGLEYKFRHVVMKKYTPNRLKIDKKPYWAMRNNRYRGDNIELYLSCQYYAYKKRQGKIIGWVNTDVSSMLYDCVGKSGDDFIVYAGFAIGGVPRVNYNKQLTRVLENYLSDKPEVLKRYQEYDMDIYDICDYYDSLFK